MLTANLLPVILSYNLNAFKTKTTLMRGKKHRNTKIKKSYISTFYYSCRPTALHLGRGVDCTNGLNTTDHCKVRVLQLSGPDMTKQTAIIVLNLNNHT